MSPSSPPCEHDLEHSRLRREVGRLKRILFAALILALAPPLFSARLLQQPQVLRVKGVVVVDESGRECILIGAPIPHAAGRVREDSERAQAAWGQRFGDFEWQATLDHATNGILLLDESGHDRIALGDPVPDPTIGWRIAPGSGLSINDQHGDDRSGWDYFQALDRVGERGAFFGVASENSFATGLDAALHGLLVRDATGPRLVAGSTGGKPGIELRDEQGKTALRLPEGIATGPRRGERYSTSHGCWTFLGATRRDPPDQRRGSRGPRRRGATAAARIRAAPAGSAAAARERASRAHPVGHCARA